MRSIVSLLDPYPKKIMLHLGIVKVKLFHACEKR